MPDLGQYAAEVTLAYAGSMILLAGIVLLSWRQARLARHRLEEAEGRANG